MAHEQVEEPESSQSAEGSSSADKRVKYLRLLEPSLSPDDDIWREFKEDVRRECMKRQTLQPHADRWAQDTVLTVWKNLAKLTSPWGYAIGTLDRKTSEAIRENQRARKAISINNDEDDETEKTGGKDIIERHKELWDTDSPERIFESSGAAEFERLFEEKLENCAISAISKLSRSLRNLFVEYYKLGTHDRKKREGLVQKYRVKSYNNLQVKIHRSWPAVLRMVGECMEKSGVSLTTVMETSRYRKLVKDYVKKDIRSKSFD